MFKAGSPADFLADRWRHRAIAILHDGSTYGLGLAEQVRQQLNADGVKEVLHLTYMPGAADYSTIVEQLQRTAAEVVYIGGYGPDAARILRQARERGDDIQLVGGHALGMAEFWSIAGAAGEGTIFTGRRDAGVGPEDQRVLRELQARGLGQHPTSLASYAAVEIWAQTVQRIRTFDLAAVTAAFTVAVSTPSWAGWALMPRAISRAPPGNGRCGAAGTTSC